MYHRQYSVLKTTNSKPDYAASYTVTTLPVGAVVASASSGTTITVNAPHSFVAGDKILLNPGSDNTFSGTDTVQSVTATTVVMGQSYSVSVGDTVANLGPDTGTSAPNYDASPVPTYTDIDGGTANANSTVTCDTEGDYDYYYKGDGLAWELIRDSSGTVVGIIKGFGGLDRYNVADFGAAVDGTTDDNSRIQSAITAAGATVTVAASGTQYAIGGRVVYLPPGDICIDSALEIESDSVHFVGSGKGICNLVAAEGTRAITVGDGTNRIFNVRLADFTVSYDDQHHTINTAPSADTIAILIQEPRKFEMENVTVYFDEENAVVGLTGIKTVGMEPGTIKNCEVHNCYGTTSGNFGVGFYISGGAANRGNIHLDTLFARHCQVGFKIEDTSNIYNSVVMTNPKVVNLSSGVSRDPKYGIWINGSGVFGVTLIEPHVEGEDGDNFEVGYFFDSCTGVTVIDPLLSRCTTGFDIDGVQGIFINNPYFMVGTFTTGFDIDASTTNWRIEGARRRGVVSVTTWLTDASGAASEGIAHWKANTSGADLQNWHLSGKAEIGNLQSVTPDAGSDDLTVGSSGAGSGITIVSDNNQSGSVTFADTDSATAGGIQFDHSNNFFNFRLAGSTRIRYNSNGDLIFVGNNGAEMDIRRGTEEITITGASQDSTATLVPADSLILCVQAYITTTIDNGTNLTIGDDTGTSDSRFLTENGFTKTAGTSFTGLDQWDSGEVHEVSGQKLRIKISGTPPTSGAMRVVVWYINFTDITS